MSRCRVLCSIYIGAFDAAELTITVGSTKIVVNTADPNVYSGNNPGFNVPWFDPVSVLFGATFSTVGLTFPGALSQVKSSSAVQLLQSPPWHLFACPADVWTGTH